MFVKCECMTMGKTSSPPGTISASWHVACFPAGQTMMGFFVFCFFMSLHMPLFEFETCLCLSGHWFVSRLCAGILSSSFFIFETRACAYCLSQTSWCWPSVFWPLSGIMTVTGFLQNKHHTHFMYPCILSHVLSTHYNETGCVRGMYYRKVICIIWKRFPENRMKQLCIWTD